MIAQRFSLREFEKLGMNSDAAWILASELRANIELEIFKLMQEAFEEIVAELKSQGHELKPYERVKPSVLHFRDIGDFEKDFPGKLYVGMDLQVGVGFPHIDEVE